jgi:hypothetical protein
MVPDKGPSCAAPIELRTAGEMQQIALALSGIDEADCVHTDISVPSP